MSEQKLKPAQFISFYLLWGVSSLLCVLDWLVARAAVTAVVSAVAASIPKEVQIERQWFLRWPVAALDKFALVILGIAAMLVVMALDYVYRDGLIKGTIKKRFLRVTAIQAGILLLSALAIGISSRVV
jgi:hypothetical protein